MKIDMHVHLADIESILKSDTERNASVQTKRLERMLRKAYSDLLPEEEGVSFNEQWRKRLLRWIKESQLDKAVLLAIDSVYDESGKACPEKTVIHVDNDFIASTAKSDPAFIFGASIHPYRKDAVRELERVVKKGARVIKWIPSAQHIEPDNPLCFPFYEALAHYNIPLLSHTGMEHALGTKRLAYNHPEKLLSCLKRGVKVIAAHCGLRLFLHERSFFKSWAFLAREYENFYGDTGAFSAVTRIPYLKKILKDKVLSGKLVYGSDFPGIPSPVWCWQLGIKKMWELSRMDNPLERNLLVMQASDMDSSVLERANDLLNIKGDTENED